ncbi:hypothetical protein CR492_09190 [Methylocella silvestris]|uniref:Uncharacterized protein n=1 Tax=Methylocella silvestris TaxID=199596 RepID=A0A2J7THN6_METSI|nr:hypothetical protein CR492_09190 [Methylocella silvestris]
MIGPVCAPFVSDDRRENLQIEVDSIAVAKAGGGVFSGVKDRATRQIRLAIVKLPHLRGLPSPGGMAFYE